MKKSKKFMSRSQINSCLERLIQESYTFLRQAERKVKAADSSTDETVSRFLEKPYKERLKTALANQYERVTKHFDAIGDNTPFDYFVGLQLGPGYNYNTLDFAGTLRVGAAIWMLEKIADAGHMEEARVYLPNLMDIYDENSPHFPFNISTLRFDGDLVESMSLALTFRYFKEDWHHQKIRKYHLTSCLLSDSIPNGKPLCSEYQKLLSFIPKEDIEYACSQFKEKMWDLFKRAYACQAFYLARLDSIVEQKRSIKNQFKVPVCGMLKPDDVLRSMIRSSESLQESQELIKDRLSSILLDLPHLCYKTKDEIVKEGLDPQIYEILKGFTVGDPFALCFALVYLLDTNDDAPWLFYSAGMLMAYVYGRLPWGDPFDSLMLKPFYGCKPGSITEEFGKVEYSPEYSNSHYALGEGVKLSLAQCIFRTSHVVVPYNALVCDGAGKQLEVKNETCFDALCGLLSLEHVNGASVTSKIEDESSPEYQEQSEALRTALKSAANMKFQVKEKEAQIDELKKQLEEAERQKNRALAKADAVLSESQAERRELADLRELMFNQENGVDDTVTGDSSVSYPYMFKKSMVVYGGHDTFLKVMKERFPNARFIDTTVVNADVVRNADILWVQTNCISHPQYWNLVRAASLHNKPLRYFVAAGTERCSRQMIEADEE